MKRSKYNNFKVICQFQKEIDACFYEKSNYAFSDR